MLDYRTSELYRQLVRQGLAKPPAGTDGIGGMKAPGAAIEARTGKVAGNREGKRQGLKLIWTNPAIGGRTVQMRRPMLVVVT